LDPIRTFSFEPNILPITPSMWLAIRQVSPCSAGKYYIRPLGKGSRWDSVAYPFERARHLQIVLSTTSGLYIFTIWFKGSSLSWSYSSWVNNYLCNHRLSLLTLWIWTPLRRVVLDTALCDKVISDLRQDGGFLYVLRFPSPLKLIAQIQSKYCWKCR